MQNERIEDLALTPTQFAILDAVLAGKGVYGRRDSVRGDFYQVSPNAAGGAAVRAAAKLRDRGFLTERDVWGQRVGVALELESNKLTVKGYRALDAHLRGRRFDPTDARLELVAVGMAERAQVEERIALAKREARAKEDARYQRDREARRLGKLAALRRVLVDHGLAQFVEGLSEGQILAFADDVRGAEFKNVDVPHMTDEDLSADLDRLEKERHTPGTVGSDLRGERVQAIRDELARRAGL